MEAKRPASSGRGGRALLSCAALAALAGCDWFRETSCNCPDAVLVLAVIDRQTGQEIAAPQFAAYQVTDPNAQGPGGPVTASSTGEGCPPGVDAGTPSDGGAPACSEWSIPLCEGPSDSASGFCVGVGQVRLVVSASGYTTQDVGVQVLAATETPTSCSCEGANVTPSPNVTASDDGVDAIVALAPTQTGAP